MKHGFFHRLDVYGRRATPALTFLLLLLVGLLPVPIAGLPAIAPLFTLIAVYYWSIYRPEYMPPWLVLALGLIEDLSSGSALGLSATTLLLVHLGVAAQRRFFISRPFVAAWWGFILVGALAAIGRWLLLGALTGNYVALHLAAFQYALTLALCPCIAWLLAQAQRHLLKPVDE
ncbi:MAG: rod shape-determining protein MreD [Alphaproteobacteria bacterium]|nr:rod shape-determining protein MreD [Alphaproteobacteria bacterium]